MIEIEKQSQFLQKLEIGSEFGVLAAGDSMLPTIENGQLLTVRRIKIKKVNVGDIVCIYQQKLKIMVTHRVISKSKGRLKTKGDNSSTADSWLSDETNFLGVVVKINKQKRNFSEKLLMLRKKIKQFFRSIFQTEIR